MVRHSQKLIPGRGLASVLALGFVLLAPVIVGAQEEVMDSSVPAEGWQALGLLFALFYGCP